MRFKVRSLLLLLPPVILVVWTVVLYQFPPSDIVEQLGVSNGYVATLVLSFVGGLSTFISVPYHLVIMTFAAGGMNPWLLGLVASVGQCAGDSISYLLGYSGKSILPRSTYSVIERFQRWCIGRPYWQFAGALILYGSMSPFSNDWILIPMGLARYPYRRVIIPLEIGNMVFNTGAALLGAYGLSSILAS
jgi:membrane protein YqaA with SNARE-associated domain